MTSIIDTGCLLFGFVAIEILALRRKGIVNKFAIAAGRPAIDHVAHLAGFATGIAAAVIVRSTDPRWQKVERRHLWNGSAPRTGNRPEANPTVEQVPNSSM